MVHWIYTKVMVFIVTYSSLMA